MQLTEEQKELLEKNLLDKWFKEDETKCPICQNSKWVVNTNIFELHEFNKIFNDNNIFLNNYNKNSVFPVVILVCENCSYCLSFSAVQLGLIPQCLTGVK
jgi:hypothetical protein